MVSSRRHDSQQSLIDAIELADYRLAGLHSLSIVEQFALALQAHRSLSEAGRRVHQLVSRFRPPPAVSEARLVKGEQLRWNRKCILLGSSLALCCDAVRSFRAAASSGSNAPITSQGFQGDSAILATGLGMFSVDERHSYVDGGGLAPVSAAAVYSGPPTSPSPIEVVTELGSRRDSLEVISTCATADAGVDR